ncbi:hypothetical protein FRC03_009488 [Tulasnella sp. 419]|nr:hypothetical protein FRC03_009488 [Tulasnella sp. 419]
MVSRDLPSHGTRLLGILIELIFYGIYSTVVVFAITTMSGNFSQRRSKVVPAVVIFLFLNTTACVALQVADLWAGFFTYEGGPAKFYADHPTGSAQGAGGDLLSALSLVVTDAFLIWRLYVIWGHNWRVCIVPSLLLLGGPFVAGVTNVIIEFKVGYWSMNGWAYATVILSIALNILVTLLICGKIWQVERASRSGNAPNRVIYRAVMTSLIESGALYIFFVILWISCHIFKVTVVTDILPQVGVALIPLVPTCIVLHLNHTFKNDSQSSTSRLPTAILSRQTDTIGHINTTRSVYYDPDQDRPSENTYKLTIRPQTPNKTEVDCVKVCSITEPTFREDEVLWEAEGLAQGVNGSTMSGRADGNASNL